MLLLQCKLNTNLFPDSVKLIGYLASAIIVALSKPCVGYSPIAKIFFFYINKHRRTIIKSINFCLISFHLSMKIVNVNRILYFSHYICIYLHQHSWVALLLQISNYLALKIFFKKECFCIFLTTFQNLIFCETKFHIRKKLTRQK